jgi:hypothetical protein
MQNKEFDKLVESFLNPKTKLEDNASFSLASLLSLVEEVENADKVLNEVIGTSVLPTVGAKEKKYEPEAKEATKFFEIFQSVLSQNVLNIDAPIDEKIKKLIQIVNYLKEQQRIPDTTEYLSKTFSIILFVGSLNNMIGNITPDLPTVAGTFFEKFIAFMSKGQAMGEEKKIYDVVTPNEYISLKLVKIFSYTGSINGMIEFFTDQRNVAITPDLKDNGKKLSLLVGIKQTVGSIKFYSFKFGMKDFIRMLSEQKIQNYNSSIIIQKELNYLTNLQNELEANIAASEDTDELEIQLQDLKQEIAQKLAEVDRLKTIRDKTQFDISYGKLKEFETSLVGEQDKDVLSMSAEDKNRIIDTNRELFNDSIKIIIEESNLVYYKLNNFLLSDEAKRKVNAVEAYDSVLRLEKNLVQYTK